jgi:hypothetical protein
VSRLKPENRIHNDSSMINLLKLQSLTIPVATPRTSRMDNGE